MCTMILDTTHRVSTSRAKNGICWGFGLKLSRAGKPSPLWDPSGAAASEAKSWGRPGSSYNASSRAGAGA